MLLPRYTEGTFFAPTNPLIRARQSMSRISAFACALVAFALALPSHADDWPQWRGPDRTGVSKETGLLKEWPKGGPTLLWKKKGIGGGYSTPAVVGDRVYLMADRKGEEYVVALAVKDGSEAWATRVGKVGRNKGPQYPGARSTPTVDGNRIYALSSDGDVACLEKDGKLVWSKSLKKQFGGSPGAWAYSESVLIDGDVLVCTPGGRSATLLALKKGDGSVVWKCPVPGGDEAGYASAIAVEVGGVRQYVQFLGSGLVGVEAKTGKFLWRYDETIDQAANIPTPIFHDNCVFTSTSRNGSGLVRIEVDGGKVSTKQVYYTSRTKLNSIGGAVLVGEHLYATDARGRLVCLEFKTGKEKWSNPGVKSAAALCYADGMLYVRGQGGSGFGPEAPPVVALVEATPEGYKEKGRFVQPDHGRRPAWPHPVVANGRLYLRDGDVLLCYDVKARK
jgi:outer membrane protein assembly factor BamB